MSRLVADEGEFQRIRRDDLLLLYLPTFAAMFVTAAGIVLVLKIPNANPDLLPVLAGPFWAVVMVALVGIMRRARFFADEDAFCPSILPLWMVFRGIRSVRYDDIVAVERGRVPEGWRFEFHLGNGKEVLLRTLLGHPEIPGEAYDFILNQVARRGVPTDSFH